MLRIIQNNSPAGAKSYYTSPSTADYYTESQELEGQWRGEGARRLGLSGKVEKGAWDALCDNRHPETGKTLTLRRKDVRRVGYDINFHVPKSMSILYGLTNDPRLQEAFRDSVDETMRDMEAEMKTRIRRDGQNDDRVTGNMVWGEFIHRTARPIDGAPDPHLHAHCFVFNNTFDSKEGRWKAGQFADLKRDGPYFEALFHSRLAMRLSELGLPVERTRTGWEIAGIPPSAIEKFSRRTALIEAEARNRGITDDRKKAELGAKTREHKQKNLSLEELRTFWKERMTQDESEAIEEAAQKIGTAAGGEDPQAPVKAVDMAIEHSFERKSALPERTVLAAALKQGVGTCSVKAVKDEFKKRRLLAGEHRGRQYVTTPEVLAEEQAMLAFARNGRGTCAPLGAPDYILQDGKLNRGQVQAVLHVLDSRDRVILLRGGAGTGKTSMMREAVRGIEANGKKVFTFAPSADASRGVLRKEGFDNAETVARLLIDTQFQEEVRGSVLWIDEAGLLGSRTTAQLFDLAQKLDARIILSGDRRQHGSVERGAALRLLETEAGLAPAELKEIMRQKGSYKQAVAALAEGRIEDGFDQLDGLGWIKEMGGDERYKALADQYVATVTEGKSALVVSPTHAEGKAITNHIRSELRRAGKLGQDERQFQILQSADLTLAQRRDAVNVLPGDVIVFHQNARGFRRGQGVVVKAGISLPLDQAERFGVYHTATLDIAPGDVIRITKNGTTADGEHRLNNGALYTVSGFAPNGDIRLTNNWSISKNDAHIAYGYVVTSHASQGKTVDRVFIGSSSVSSPAASREQLYVSVSRGRERAVIFTDDKEALKEAVSRGDERLTAMDLLARRERRHRHATIDTEWRSDLPAMPRTSGARQREERFYER